MDHDAELKNLCTIRPVTPKDNQTDSPEAQPPAVASQSPDDVHARAHVRARVRVRPHAPRPLLAGQLDELPPPDHICTRDDDDAHVHDHAPRRAYIS